MLSSRLVVRAFFSIAVIVALAGLGCVKTPAGPALCGEQAACAGDSTCMLGRCRTPSKPLGASAEGRRLVLFPDESAVVASLGPSGGGDRLPAVVTLGRGDATVFLHFAVPVHAPGDVETAVLVLDPARDALPSAQPVAILSAPILEAWRAESVTEGRTPRVGVPERATTAGTAFGGSLRIDVTHIVKRWAERRADDHGIAIIADAIDAYGASFSLGVTEGRGPRLEVYVK